MVIRGICLLARGERQHPSPRVCSLFSQEERSLTPGGHSGQKSFIGFLVNHNSPPPRVFRKSMFHKGVKVVCFDRLLQVFILKGLELHQNSANWGRLGDSGGCRRVDLNRIFNGNKIAAASCRTPGQSTLLPDEYVTRYYVVSPEELVEEDSSVKARASGQGG